MKSKSPLAPKKNKNLNLFEGISVSSTHCGLKKNKKLDLVLIKLDEPGSILGSFTKSKTPGEPIIWNKSIIKKKKSLSNSYKLRKRKRVYRTFGKKCYFRYSKQIIILFGYPKKSDFPCIYWSDW